MEKDSPSLSTAMYNVYGCAFKVVGKEELIQKFDTNYSPFRVKNFDGDVVRLEVKPVDSKRMLPIFVKGAKNGLSFKSRKSDGEEVVQILYNSGVEGKEQRLIVDFTRFLLYWADKGQAHAAAVSKNGNGYVFFAPGNTGKTTMALQLVARGYSLIGDDWMIIDDKGYAYAYPQPIRIHDYNLSGNLQWCRSNYGSFLGLLVHVTMKVRVFFRNKMTSRLPTRALRYVTEWALTRPIREVPVDSVAHKVSSQAKIRNVYWLERRPDIESLSITEFSLAGVIERVVDTFHYEFSEYFKWYHGESQIGNKIDYIHKAPDHLTKVLFSGLQGCRYFKVQIPNTTSPEQLYSAIIPTMESVSETSPVAEKV